MKPSTEIAIVRSLQALLESNIALLHCQEGSLVKNPEFIKQFPKSLAVVEARVHCEQAKECLDGIERSGEPCV